MEYAKEYFGCDSIKGIPLENGGSSGSAGSHWEKTVFPSEVMNPQVASPMRISEFTMKAFEDMGFYKTDSGAQLYNYLKGSGCKHIVGNECTGESSEYCSNEEWGHDHCYTNNMMKGSCGKSSTFVPKCSYLEPKYNALCTRPDQFNHIKFKDLESYGAHSRCLMIAKNSQNFDAGCFRTRCNAQTNKVEIKFGETVFTCEKEGNVQINIPEFKGFVKCPNQQ